MLELCYKMLDEGYRKVPTYDPTFNNFGSCWDDVARCWKKAFQKVPIFGSSIHPTILDRVGMIVARCWTIAVQKVPTFDRPTFTQQFEPCWGDVARSSTKALQKVPIFGSNIRPGFLGHVGMTLFDVG